MDRELWLRFLSGLDIDALGLSNAEIVAAVDRAVRLPGASPLAGDRAGRRLRLRGDR